MKVPVGLLLEIADADLADLMTDNAGNAKETGPDELRARVLDAVTGRAWTENYLVDVRLIKPDVLTALADALDATETDADSPALWALSDAVSESYPTDISQPPAVIRGYCVIGWAEYSRREGEYPGGFVLGTIGAPGHEPPYALWEVHTTDGGLTWHASHGHYDAATPTEAWAVFAEQVAKQLRRRRLATFA